MRTASGLGNALRPVRRSAGVVRAALRRLCAGERALFSRRQRVAAPLPVLQWTWASDGHRDAGQRGDCAAGARRVLASLSAHPAAKQRGGSVHLLETAAGRTRFLALWGVLLGSGFRVATLHDRGGLILLPRCAG